MKMKKNIFYALGIIVQINLFGQSSSVITNENYFKNPTEYLSQIDTSKIKSDILIDRVYYDSIILNCNGINITTLDSGKWGKLYNNLRRANIDSLYLPSIDTISKAKDLFYRSNRIYTIGLLDFNFKRIKQTAIDNNEFIEGDSLLTDNNATMNSFSSHRVLAASCLSHNIYGDNVNFTFNDFFYLTNNKEQTLQSVEIDFGNGEGFKPIDRDEIITISYNSNSEYHEMVVKLLFKNTNSSETETRYAHSSYFRTGSSTIPLPDIITTQIQAKSESTTPIAAHRRILYPEAPTINKFICRGCLVGNEVKLCCASVEVPSEHTIEAHFLFSPSNTSGKLRRPIIISDGFDPGNKRDYYSRRYDDLGDLLEKEKDFRGIFQLVNGDPSPWYSDDEPDGNLIERLRNNGYDIVVINYFEGADYVANNANAFRGFLNDILNSPQFRDNKTEESIMIGPSMGGLVSRYAMTSMEQATPKEEHFIKQWISYDSPQKGANIPLALQHSMKFLTKIRDGGGLISSLTDARESFVAGINTLNTPVAKQMLLYHYTKTTSKGNSTDEFNSLYNKLDQLGFPKYSKNYAISNGGKSKLYEDTGKEIVNFKITPWTYTKGWGMHNTDGTYDILDGSRQGLFNDEEKSTISQIAYDNAPGGWNAALYTLNSQPKNWYFKREDDISYTRATFMPTPSTFGIPVTRQNIFNNWEDYTGISDNTSGKIKTPFDVVHGMEENEEHVKISPATANYLFDDVLNPEFENSQKPVVRSGQTITQNIKGQVAYVAKETITFAGDGNNFIIENTADVTSKASTSITLKSGFNTKPGASFTASIGTIDYSTILQKSITKKELKSVNYTKPSPYTGKVHIYKDGIMIPSSIEFELSISPNPASKFILINLSEIEYKLVSINILTMNGLQVYSNSFTTKNPQIDISKLPNGIYIIQVNYGNKTKNIKLIKI